VIALDASALLALLLRERGHEQVSHALAEACMSTVNLSEVLGRFARTGQQVGPIVRRLQSTPIEWVPFSSAHATIAADLAVATARIGLSLGDRACLALARERGIEAMTADKAWSRLNLGIGIDVIR